MTEPYPLVQRDGRWWLPYGLEVDAEQLAGLWMSDSDVVFLGPEGGSFAYRVDENGAEQVRLDYGVWRAIPDDLADWQQEVFRLVREALDNM